MTNWILLGRVLDGYTTRGALLLLHIQREQAAFAVEVMIPRRQDCEGDRRSWRIAICRCDALAHNFVAFSHKPLLRPLESSSNLSRILGLEMHPAVLRFMFCGDGQVSRYFGA